MVVDTGCGMSSSTLASEGAVDSPLSLLDDGGKVLVAVKGRDGYGWTSKAEGGAMLVLWSSKEGIVAVVTAVIKRGDDRGGCCRRRRQRVWWSTLPLSKGVVVS